MHVRRRLAWVWAGLVAAVAVAIVALLPPAAVTTPPASWYAAGATARGAYHVHSVRSDGSGTLDDIAAAAARAGLQFVIVTDHGDGTRPPEAPAYHHGVLIIDAVELNTTAGHLVALGLPATPYPFAGAPDAVIDDVRRLGGFGIAAHPESPRASLKWRAWSAAVDGVEWLNADSEWRDEVWDSLGRTLLTYPIRGPETLAALLDRPAAELARWDRLGAVRAVPGLAGADAHARIGFRQPDDPDAASWHVPMPGYEASFRAFANRVLVEQPLGGDAVRDAAAVLVAIRAGRVFAVIDGFATPGAFAFEATSGARVAMLGAEVRSDGGPVLLRARVSAPPGAVMALVRDGAVVRQGSDAIEMDVTDAPGVYRVEVSLATARGMPWLVSNPIYVRDPSASDAAPAPSAPAWATVVPAEMAEAHVEQAMGTSHLAREAGDPPVLSWRYTLDPGRPSGQFAAVAIPIHSGLSAFTHVRLRVQSERPARVWAQLRGPGANAERWGVTFFVDGTERVVELPLDRFTSVDLTKNTHAPIETLESLLIVADTVNTLPGGSGSLTIRDVAYLKP